MYEKRLSEIEKTLTQVKNEVCELRKRNQVLQETLEKLYEFSRLNRNTNSGSN